MIMLNPELAVRLRKEKAGPLFICLSEIQLLFLFFSIFYIEHSVMMKITYYIDSCISRTCAQVTAHILT